MLLLFSSLPLLLAPTLVLPASPVLDQAATPPRGWNSYDSYTWKVSEEAFLANCESMAKNLKSSGYEYCVVDYLWFQDLTDDLVHNSSVPASAQLRDPVTKMHIDKYGRLLPAPDRWPSAWGKDGTALGFKPVADKVHALGMKFGIHIMRGISFAAVAAKSPVLGGGGATADSIGLTDLACPWWHGVMSVNVSHPAGQAFFDSITQQYVEWGVDFLKNDCVFGHQFQPDQILAQSKAIKKTGRTIVYSLSPGATPEGQSGKEVPLAKQVAADVNMYRVTGDDWDTWGAVSSHFAVANHFASAGLIGASGLNGTSWPDMDMLPFGVISSPNSGRLPYKNCSLSHDEQTAQMTLWAIVKSPLMFGGDATQLDSFTLSLLGNARVLEMNALSSGNRQVYNSSSSIVWTARGPRNQVYVALFNVADETSAIAVRFDQLGLPSGTTSCTCTDLWTHTQFPSAGTEIHGNVRSHGVVLLSVTDCSDVSVVV